MCHSRALRHVHAVHPGQRGWSLRAISFVPSLQMHGAHCCGVLLHKHAQVALITKPACELQLAAAVHGSRADALCSNGGKSNNRIDHSAFARRTIYIWDSIKAPGGSRRHGAKRKGATLDLCSQPNINARTSAAVQLSCSHAHMR